DARNPGFESVAADARCAERLLLVWRGAGAEAPALTTLLRRSAQPALSRPAMPLVAEQMDLAAAGVLRIIERVVGFREQFGDRPAMRAADQRSSDRGASLEAMTVPENR